MYSQSCIVITTIRFRTFSSPLPQRNPTPFSYPLIIPQPLATTNLLYVSINLSILDISYKWTYAVSPHPPLAFQLYHLLVALVLAPGVVAAAQYHGPLEVGFPFWVLNLLQASSSISCPWHSGGLVNYCQAFVHVSSAICLTNVGFSKVR